MAFEPAQDLPSAPMRIAKCRAFLEKAGAPFPDPNPWEMERPALRELMGLESREESPFLWNLDRDRMEAYAIEWIDAENCPGLDAWRSAVQKVKLAGWTEIDTSID